MPPSTASRADATLLRAPTAGCGHSEEGLFDPAFREHFQVSQATQRYAALLAAVPAAFVGPCHRLIAAARLLCKELQAEFTSKGLPPPP